jgi:hypothetical protein
MSSDAASVPEPVAAPAPAPAPADPVTKAAEDIAGIYNVADWKKPVPTVLAIYAHVSTMTALTGEQRIKAVQQIILIIAKRSGTSEDESAATFFANEVLPHIVHAMEVVSAGKAPAVEAIKDFAQTEMKAVPPVVIAELKKVSGWCW